MGWADLLPDLSLDPGARLGATVLRIHTSIQFLVDSTTPVTSADGFIAVGVHMFQVQEAGGGEIGLVGPYAQASSGDWMLWDVAHPSLANTVIQNPAITGPPAHPASMQWVQNFDGKAKRRFEFQSDKIWLKLQPTNPLANVVNWSALTSILVRTS